MNNVSEHALAVLVDIENMARPGARNRGEFDIHLVLNRLAEKGRVVVKRAYADWSRYRDARRELMNAGLELIEMPSAREGAKNRADIKMAVDAMEIAYSRQHVDNFVIVSGDSDFTPLVGKLRELNKRVIGVGRDVSSASPLLIANCDEFFFYDSLASKAVPHIGGSGVRPDALSLLRETLMARQREGDELPQASAVKDSMRRRDPAFDEGEIGFATFSKFLEDAQAKGVVRLHMDPRSGTFTVELVEGPGVSDWPTLGEPPSVEERPVEIGEGRRRRRRRRGESAAERPVAEEEAATDDGAEVFVIELRDKEFTAEMPPLDQPITYEDIVLSGAEVGEEAPELVEATDVAEGPPTRGSRRRRRSLASVPELTAEDLDADAEEAAAATEPEAEDAAEAAPTSRRRVRRGSVLGTLTKEESATAEEASAEEEKPKPRRRSRAKAAEEATAEAVVAEEEKPKRRTRAKKADQEEAAAATAEEEKPKRGVRTKKVGEEEAGAETASEEKPKRRSRSRKAAEPEAADEAAGISAKESPY